MNIAYGRFCGMLISAVTAGTAQLVCHSEELRYIIAVAPGDSDRR